MGTNYYLHTAVCPHCGRGDEPLHIGKSSAGWCFSLHVIPERGINTLDDWRDGWAKAGTRISDEYGESIPVSMMEETITKRAHHRDASHIPYGYASWADFHRDNCSEPGPNGLVRHRIDAKGDHGISNGCIGHGAGTWDYITGEFS